MSYRPRAQSASSGCLWPLMIAGLLIILLIFFGVWDAVVQWFEGLVLHTFPWLVNFIGRAFASVYDLLNQDLLLTLLVTALIVQLPIIPISALRAPQRYKMQMLQPYVKGLQEKYKDDRERLRQSQLELYRSARVNPLGNLPLNILNFVFRWLMPLAYGASTSALLRVDSETLPLLDADLQARFAALPPWNGVDFTQSALENPLIAWAFPLIILALLLIGSIEWRQEAHEDIQTSGDNALRRHGWKYGLLITLIFAPAQFTLPLIYPLYYSVSNIISSVAERVAEWAEKRHLKRTPLFPTQKT